MWWDKILGSKPATADTKRNGGGREGKIRERKGINMIQLVVGSNECIYGLGALDQCLTRGWLLGSSKH